MICSNVFNKNMSCLPKVKNKNMKKIVTVIILVQRNITRVEWTFSRFLLKLSIHSWNYFKNRLLCKLATWWTKWKIIHVWSNVLTIQQATFKPWEKISSSLFLYIGNFTLLNLWRVRLVKDLLFSPKTRISFIFNSTWLCCNTR